MPIENQETRRIRAPLAYGVGEDADAGQIAEATVAIWQEIDKVLTPIIGKGGVAALYKRSLHVTSSEYPWLATRQESGQTAMDPAALKPLLAKQSSTDAAAGSSAVLQTFHELLSTLIGPSLTKQLLRSVWAPHCSGAPAQDISP